MKTIELVKMEDYALSLELSEDTQCIELAKWHNLIVDYARLLKQPLTLGMFVPCDEDGNVLDSPEVYLKKYENTKFNNGLAKSLNNAQYQQAIDRVIFEGFEVPYKPNEHSIVVRWKLKPRVELNFRTDGLVMLNGKEIKTISDLCGYGLKIKME